MPLMPPSADGPRLHGPKLGHDGHAPIDVTFGRLSYRLLATPSAAVDAPLLWQVIFSSLQSARARRGRGSAPHFITTPLQAPRMPPHTSSRHEDKAILPENELCASLGDDGGREAPRGALNMTMTWRDNAFSCLMALACQHRIRRRFFASSEKRLEYGACSLREHRDNTTLA